jgi:murein DD-endopeptidase MepM/ murein hydrolase activator NlpD
MLPVWLMLFTLVPPMRLRRLATLPALVALFALALAPSGGPVHAQSNTDKQNQLKQQILEATAVEQAAWKDLQDVRARKAAIDARVAELDGQIRNLQAALVPLEAEVVRLSAAYDEAQARLTAKQAELDVAKAQFDASAADMYRAARSGSNYDYIRVARPQDLVQGAKYLDEVNAKQHANVRRITVLRDAIEEQRRSLSDQKAKADAAAAEVQKAKDEIASLRADIEPARAQAAQEAANEEAVLAESRAKVAELEKEFQRVSDEIAAQLRGSSDVSGTPGGCQYRPVPGAIVSGFGYRTNPIGGGTGFHSGVDMAASYGTPIRACRAGKIVIAGVQGGYGNAVVIDHGGGMGTLYGHQSSMAVVPGQTVQAGTIIGYVGSTGNSTGPHLHFEVRLGGSPVDPVPYL